MDLVSLVVGLIVILLIFWAVRMLLSAFGVGDPIATVIYVLLVIVVIVWLLGAIGGSPNLGHLRLR